MNKRLTAVAKKEILHILRDRRTLGMVIFLPLLMLLLYGYALTFDIRLVQMALLDEDHSSESRQLLDEFISSGYFKLRYRLSTPAEMGKYLDRGDVKMVLHIPADFSRQLLAKRAAPVQIIIDGSDSNAANQIFGYTRVISENYGRKIMMSLLGTEGLHTAQFRRPIDFRPRVWYNPELKSTNFLIPGIIGIIMTLITVNFVSLAIVRDKERGTIEGIMASPISKLEYILGKILPYLGISFIDLILVLLVGVWVLKVPFRGSLLLFFALSFLFFLFTVGAGLFISTLTSSQQIAWMASFLGTMLPSIILSGFVFPIENMPRALQMVTYLVPARYFISILRAIVLKGLGLSYLLQETLILTIFAIVMISLSTLRFKKQIA
ncbi:MAG: ABC transporter permease [Candidatus Aminicenantes bacterium]|nr:ABC transporter permease [Candidatus Aminicenantes bacterium]MDH5714072.1 ABC transporter permease [Candidatus Aminicenantes bacterium]